MRPKSNRKAFVSVATDISFVICHPGSTNDAGPDIVCVCLLPPDCTAAAPTSVLNHCPRYVPEFICMHKDALVTCPGRAISPDLFLCGLGWLKCGVLGGGGGL